MRMSACRSFLRGVLLPVAATLLTGGIVHSQRILKVPAQYPSVQKAIDAAQASDTVLVSPGIYNENIDFRGKAITVRSTAGARLTTLDPDAGGSVVVFRNGEGRSSVLEGFTVTGGTGTFDFGWVSGGGLFCKDSSPTIRDNVITGNVVSGLGGGIYITGVNAAPMVTRNVISRNQAMGGGGIMHWNSFFRPGAGVSRIQNNRIEMNAVGLSPLVSGSGGGISVESSIADIRNNVVINNVADRTGGVEYYSMNVNASAVPVEGNLILDNRSPQVGGISLVGVQLAPLINNVIAGNVSSLYDAGGVEWSGRAGVILNNTIAANYAGGNGGGIELALPSTGQLVIANTIIWGNRAGGQGPSVFNRPSGFPPTVLHCDVEGGWTGQGNFDADPGFVDPGRRDFHLRGDSPCVNTGQTAAVATHDFEGDPRIFIRVIDVGADEVHYRLYRVGEVQAGATFFLRLIGAPGQPAYLGVSPGLLAQPAQVPGLAGLLHLDPTHLVVLPLGPVALQAYVEVPVRLPPGFPRITLYAQALSFGHLTNVETFRVE